MSQNTPELHTISKIPPSMKQNWTDLNKDGRRMDKIIKSCLTEYNKKDKEYEYRLAFLDRLLKCTTIKEKLARTVLGVDEVLAEAKKR